MTDKNGPITLPGDGARAESSSQPNARSEIEKRQPKPSHPAAEIFRLMQGKKFEALAASIATDGLQEEIALYGGPDPEHVGKILDGRNRERACIAAGVEPRYKSVVPKDNDSLTYVLIANGLRRQLSIKEKRATCAKALEFDPTRSDRQFAVLTGLNGHTVASIRKELEASGVIPTVTARAGADNKVRQLPKGEAPNAEEANRASCTVGDVPPGSAAAAAGFQPGDLVLAIDGRPVESFQDIQQIISTSTGETLVFEVDRGGVKVTLKAPRLTAEAEEAETNRAFCAVEPGEAETSARAAAPAKLFGAILTGLKASHDEAPGDEAPGDEAPGDEAPGDEAPGDGDEALGHEALHGETSGSEAEFEAPDDDALDALLKEKLSPNEYSAYEEFAEDVKNRVLDERISLDESVIIVAMRVRELLGHKPATMVAAANGEVERLREANHTLKRQYLAYKSEVEELTAENVKLKADLAAALEVASNKGPTTEGADSKQPQGKSQPPQRKSKRGRQ